MARIAPDGRTADYVTHLRYTAPNPGAAFVDSDGTLYVFGEAFRPVPDTGGGQGETFIAKVGPAVATWPRVDAVTNPGQISRLAYPGARLVIEGEGFGADTRVWLGDLGVAPEKVTEGRLEVVIPGDQELGAVEMRVESGGSRSAPVRMVVEARP